MNPRQVEHPVDVAEADQQIVVGHPYPIVREQRTAGMEQVEDRLEFPLLGLMGKIFGALPDCLGIAVIDADAQIPVAFGIRLPTPPVTVQ